MDMEIVSFVILHYGDRETTDACVQSILRLKGQERIRIVIVDNDIEKEERQRRRLCMRYQENSRITVLLVQEGGGFSHGNNLGYQYAREVLGASCILVLNNDIQFPQAEFLELLEKSIRKHPCHVLGPDVIRQSTGEHQNPMDTRIRTRKEAAYTVRMNRLALKCYSLIYPLLYLNLKKEEKRRLRRASEREDYYGKLHRGIVPFGACLIFTPDFVKREALAFTPETQFYYEEYLLTRRCQYKGYHTLYDPSLKVLHESGAATRATFRQERRRIRFLLERTAEAGKIYLDYLERIGE